MNTNHLVGLIPLDGGKSRTPRTYYVVYFISHGSQRYRPGDDPDRAGRRDGIGTSNLARLLPGRT